MSKKAQRKAPPLFGVATVNDIYCDIIRNVPRSEWSGVTMPLLAITPLLLSFFFIGPIIEYSPFFIVIEIIFILIMYASIHALRVVITHPKTLTVRLNRKRQRVYVQMFRPTRNLFAKWPVETLIYDWKDIEAHFSHGSGTAGSRTWYKWQAPSTNRRKNWIIISDDNAPLFYKVSRFSTDIADTLFSYAESWAWCRNYMNGIMTPVQLLPIENNFSYKYCVTALSSRMLSRVNEHDRWTTIFPVRNPLFWILSFIVVPTILLDALAMRWILRRLPETPWSEEAQVESITDGQEISSCIGN